jgi:hypothetical protein
MDPEAAAERQTLVNGVPKYTDAQRWAIQSNRPAASVRGAADPTQLTQLLLWKRIEQQQVSGSVVHCN